MPGARDADLIIAATHSDEVNMVTCQVAHSVFQIPRKIARLRSAAYLDAIYSDLYRTEHLPIDVVISPEREVAKAALQRLSAPSTFDVETFLRDKVHLLGIVLERRLSRAEHPAAAADRAFLVPPRHRGGGPARRPAVCARAGGPAVRRGSDLYLQPCGRRAAHAGYLRQAPAEAGAAGDHRRRAMWALPSRRRWNPGPSGSAPS